MGKEYKNHKTNKLLFIPAFGVAALSSAVILGAAPSTFAQQEATSHVTLSVGSVISLSTQDITLNAGAPTSAGAFVSGNGSVTVTTNDAAGYSVYITSSNASTSLNHETVSTAKINSIAAPATIDSTNTKFATANTWGWSNNATTFNPVQAQGTKNGTSTPTLFRKTNAPATTADVSTLTVGATINSALVAGNYTGTLLLTAIPNSNTTALANY